MTTDHSFTVLVVEDDPVVARVHCKLVASLPSIRVIGVARSAPDARYLTFVHKPHILVLDVGLPGRDGLSLLRELRSRGSDVEVIVVTAGASPQLVRSMLHLGVADYLVKPFTPERLSQALRQTQSRLLRTDRQPLQQGAIDDLRRSMAPASPWVPRDLSADRLRTIRDTLKAAARPMATEEVAEQVHVARVTARRYLEYMVTTREADESEESGGRGRPRKYYTYRPPSEIGGRL